MNEALIFGGLIGVAALMGFVALWQLSGKHDPVGTRLQQYKAQDDLPPDLSLEVQKSLQRPSSAKLNRLVNGFGLGRRLAQDLTRADLPLTVGEYALVMLALGVLGFLIGIWRMGPILGMMLAVVFAVLPIPYARMAAKKRQNAFTEQLPNVLTLMVSALQAGYGLGQSLQVLVEQLPPPVSVEFSRVLRAVGLGLPMPRALADMVKRIGTDDIDLVVTAISIQYESGGNLSQTLDVIGQTVRDRIRIQREIRVMTSQQRLTGYILGGLPIALGFALFMINPTHMRKLFDPGLMRFVLVGAVVMQVTGFVVVQRLLDIEV